MRADKCYCRPHRESLPQWPCEDASTAFKLCCLSATVYDVRCYWNTTTYQGELVDHSPGDVIGTGQNGDLLINCPATGYNTNLQGKAFFWFADADQTDQVNPWRPCPQVCSTVRVDGIDSTNCMTGVQVTWSYSCDTGLVTFNSTWIFEPGGQPPSFLTSPSVGIVTADPDWYLDDEIDIPYLTSGVNDNRPRFSLTLKLTCEPVEECQDYACLPRCLVKVCNDSVGAFALFVEVTSVNGCCLDGSYQLTWDGSSYYSGKIGDQFLVSCGYVEIWYQCSGATFQRRIKITDVNGGVSDTTSNDPGACSGSPSNFEDTFDVLSSFLTPICFNLPPFYTDTVTFDVFTNN